MNICHVWDSDYPWDVRVEKVSTALTGAGHTVEIVARNRRRQSRVESLPEGTVHRLPAWGWLPRELDAGLMFPAFFNPRWASAISRTARNHDSDLILVRDLPLAPTAIMVGRHLEIPVMLDMAENYGAMMQALWDNGVQRPWDFLVRNPSIVRKIERWVLRHVNHVSVVVEESAERLIRLGLPSDRVTVVCNTPDAARLNDFPIRSLGTNGKLHIVYLGLLERPRGVATLLRSVAQCVREGIDVSAEIIGDGRERSSLVELSTNLGLGSERVQFKGYVPYAEALNAFRRADAGIVPHFANESWNTTIPNKLFDYMSAGLPVLCSNAVPAARVVRETQAGLVYSFDKPEELTKCIERLLDAHQRQTMGTNGRAAIASKFNWNQDAPRLVAAVNTLASKRKK